jgi:triacylglycerol esterase/lipase EstA (alpha/beta hydrolase family)
MRHLHHIFLVPGFFGFANLGRLRYFVHVDRFLRERCAALGIDAQVHVVKTEPTASLTARAAQVAGEMARRLRGPRAVAHLVGHSTGGLDARLVAAPGVSLPTRSNVDRCASRVRTVIGVSVPHRGAPLAAFFATRGGQQLLLVLSLVTSYVLRFGHLPVSALLRVATSVRGANPPRLQRTLFDELSQRLLGDFSVGRRRAVARLLRQVVSDRSLLPQLAPEAMDVFNAAVRNRSGVRYGSVVTLARPPGLRSTLRTGLDPSAQAMHAIYQALYRLAAQRADAATVQPSPSQRRALRRAYGGLPSVRANDGIVPTLSQPWGDVIAAVRADHLDVVGHLDDSATDPPHFDWLPTRTGFDRPQFDRVWSRVLDFMLASAPSESR